MKCFYCPVEMVRTEGFHPRQETTDHVIPKSDIKKAGVALSPQEHEANSVRCCSKCNYLKGRKKPWEWADLLPPDEAKRFNQRLERLPVTLIYGHLTAPSA